MALTMLQIDSTRINHLDWQNVDPAFLAVFRFPPPAPGANVFAGPYRTGAGIATDRRIAAVVQCVVGHFALADIGPDLLLAPIRQRIEFHQAMGGVEVAHA